MEILLDEVEIPDWEGADWGGAVVTVGLCSIFSNPLW